MSLDPHVLDTYRSEYPGVFDLGEKQNLKFWKNYLSTIFYEKIDI